MADKIEFSLTGLDEVTKKMKGLPNLVRQKAARKALGKSASLVARAARKNAERVDDPETGRRIRDNIGQRFRSAYYRQTGDVMISVGVLTKRGRIPKGNPDEGPKGNTPHWHLIEEGREGVEARPFLRPALSENIGAATDVFARNLEQEISKAVDQL